MTSPTVYSSRSCHYSVQADHILVATNDSETKILFSQIVNVVRDADSVVLRLTEGSAYIGLRGEERDSFLAELNAARGIVAKKA